MKKIIFTLCFIAFCTKAMEIVDVQFEGKIPVDSYQKLHQLAVVCEGNFNKNFAEKYMILPQSIAEYISCHERSKSAIEDEVLALVKSEIDIHPLSKDIIQEIWLEHTNSVDVAITARNGLFSHSHTKKTEVEKQITDLSHRYEEAKNKNRCAYFCSFFAVGGFVAGTGLIGLFSWVINHCHHPWNSTLWNNTLNNASSM